MGILAIVGTTVEFTWNCAACGTKRSATVDPQARHYREAAIARHDDAHAGRRVIVPRAITQGYWLDYAAGSEDQGHVFCGPQEIQGTTCPSCDEPLLQFARLDHRDSRLGLVDLGTAVPLLYCWRCGPLKLAYALRDSGIEILENDGEWQGDDFPYANYPRFFPARAAVLRPLSADQQFLVRLENLRLGHVLYDFDDDDDARPVTLPSGRRVPRGEIEALFPECVEPRHQVGGEPWSVQGAFPPLVCSACELPMRFLAAIADDCTDPRGFVDNAYVQTLFFLCRDCRVIAATQQCD